MSVSPTLLDIACEKVSSAPGTSSTIALGGGVATGGYLTWANAGAVNGAIYRIVILDGGNRELAYATYNSSSNEFTSRTTLIASVAGVMQTTAISASANAVIGSVALAEDMLTPATVQAVMPGGGINAIRNPGMDISQRGTSGSVSSGSTAYTLDGHQISTTGAAAAWAKEFNANIAGNALRISCATGLTACTLQERIESYYAARLLTAAKAGQPCTIQWTIYNNTGASITPQVAAGYASSQDNFGTVTSDLSATNLQTIANGTMGTVSYTFTPNANMANGYELQLQFGGSLNASSGYVDISRCDFRVTPNLPTGLNANPPPAEMRSPHTEFQFCQRYLPGVSGAGPWAATYDYADSGSVCCGYVPRGYFVVAFLNQARISPTGISSSGANATFTFSAASQSMAQSAMESSPPTSPWGGSSSTSWAVFTGAEL